MRGVTKEQKDRDAKRGALALKKFIAFIETKYGGKCYLSTIAADMYDHVDFDYITKTGKKIRIDFKAVKRITKFADDDSEEDAYNFLELTAVDGSVGWVYGKADYICFETSDSWLWVPRSSLGKFVDQHVSSEPPVVGTKCTPEYHLRRYQRSGRKDIITVITKNELIGLSTKKDKKP